MRYRFFLAPAGWTPALTPGQPALVCPAGCSDGGGLLLLALPFFSGAGWRLSAPAAPMVAGCRCLRYRFFWRRLAGRRPPTPGQPALVCPGCSDGGGLPLLALPFFVGAGWPGAGLPRLASRRRSALCVLAWLGFARLGQNFDAVLVVIIKLIGIAIFAMFCQDASQHVLRHPQIYILQVCIQGWGLVLGGDRVGIE